MTDNQTRIKELLLQKKQLEELIQEMRKKRHYGMDDDRAEDIVEEYYRELLEVERELEFLKNN
ncbi:MAG: hypothetical protein J6J23_07610 [Clostridia bacterium]|nr:hypothetical protein [Clostridia bacterium]